jgi:hypothetical protein
LLLKLAAEVENGRTNDPDRVFVKLLHTYGVEYANDEPDYTKLFMFVSDVILDSLTALGNAAFADKMDETRPLRSKMDKSATVLQQIANVCLRARPLSKEELYYVTSVLYALDSEGPFDQACRLIYYFYKNSHKQPISLAAAQRIELRDLRDNLARLTKGKSKILFVGWNDRRLRNAVAHVGLEYDATSNSMTFSDRERSRTLPWTEFEKYYQLTRGASSVFLHVMLLLSAHNLAFCPKPFEDKT